MIILNGLNRYFDPNGVDYLEKSQETVRNIVEKLILARKTETNILFINDYEVTEDHTKKEKFNNNFLEELTPLKNEDVLIKYHPSAFIQSTLEDKLQGLGINELVITGAETNTSVFFTAVDAKQRGYKVMVFEDCVTTNDKITQAVFIQEMADKYSIKVF